jgi:uncharacterized protein YehS (DUF1456 family)
VEVCASVEDVFAHQPAPTMIHNDVLRSVRYMLNLGDANLAALIGLGGVEVPTAEVSAFLKHEDEPGYQVCGDAIMASFLDGLIIYRRGRKESAAPRPVERNVTNNTVLKKLRVAFELREEDLITMMTDAGFKVSRPEMSALFRNPGHLNYRPCGDQFLRNFLKSLTARVRAR